MLSWQNSGFSLNADVRIESWDREGLERLLRYCARPSFASENLRWHRHWVVYRLSKPTYRGVTSINLRPLEFLDRITELIPPSKKHRHHYHGVFAPNAPMRKRVSSCANKTLDKPNKQLPRSTRVKVRRATISWAKLIARIYKDNPLLCSCGEKMKIIAFITSPSAIRQILFHMGHPLEPPLLAAARDPPQHTFCQLLDTEDGFSSDLEPQTEYDECEFSSDDSQFLDTADGFLE
jgi:hypothetical protein